MPCQLRLLLNSEYGNMLIRLILSSRYYTNVGHPNDQDA